MTKDSDTIRVMLVDDHAMVRKGLITFLKAFKDLELIGEASNGAEAIRLCEQELPDVILMDIVMPEMDGIQTTTAILEKYPDVKIIALTSFKEDHIVKAVMEAGAIGFVEKDVSIEDLGDAIRKAQKGQGVLSDDATNALIRMANRPESFGDNLTPRELEVLAQMAEGLTNSDIAEKLMISALTVKTHVGRILSKLEVSNRTEAVTLAIKNKILPDSK